MTETFTEQQTRIRTEQADMTKDDIMEQLPAEYKLDLDNLPKSKHNWVPRGAVVSCEGADHPSHRHFLVKRGKRKE